MANMNINEEQQTQIEGPTQHSEDNATHMWNRQASEIKSSHNSYSQTKYPLSNYKSPNNPESTYSVENTYLEAKNLHLAPKVQNANSVVNIERILTK